MIFVRIIVYRRMFLKYHGRKMSPGEIAAEAAATENNIGLAFTYNEPVIWFEFMRDAAEAVKEKGMLYSNGKQRICKQ